MMAHTSMSNNRTQIDSIITPKYPAANSVGDSEAESELSLGIGAIIGK